MEMITVGLGGDGNPFQIPRSVFSAGHTEFRGGSGSGKTMTLMQMVVALMANSRDTMVILDLGASVMLRNGLKMGAEATGREFKEFSLTHMRMGFDPFQSFRKCDNPAIIASWATSAFQMDHGGGYGPGYFTSVNSQIIREAASEILAKGALVDMQSLVNQISRSSKTRDTEVFNVLQPLKHFPQLSSESDLEQIIIADALENGDVIYMSLDCLVAPQSARVVAGLACATVIMECISRSNQNEMDNHAFVTIDEFSQLASPAWATWLTAARKHNCNFTLAYQSTAQLSNAGKGLDEIVRENCRTHFYFTCVGSKDTDQLRDTSREVRTKLGGTSGIGLSASLNSREVVDRQLSVNEILDVSGTDREFFAIVNDGKGHREPVRVRSLEISEKELERISTAPKWMAEVNTTQQNVRVPSAEKIPVPQEVVNRMNQFFELQITDEEYTEDDSNGASSYRSNVPSVNGQKSLFAN